jgi:hypothetical protein
MAFMVGLQRFGARLRKAPTLSDWRANSNLAGVFMSGLMRGWLFKFPIVESMS